MNVDVESPPHTVRVFLVDDHAIVRSGLKALVNAQPDMSVVGEAAEGLAGLRGVAVTRPDLVVMDLAMPVLGGVEATGRIKVEVPQVKVLALTAREERGYIDLLMSAGASGCVLKRSAADDLVHAIRVIAAGGVYLDPAMATLASAPQHHAAEAPASSRLSEREAEVLRRIAEGHAVKDIAAMLAISPRTVGSMMSCIT